MPESFKGQESGEGEDSHEKNISMLESQSILDCVCVWTCVHIQTHTIKQIYMYLICEIFSKHLLCTKSPDPRVDLEGKKDEHFSYS